MGRTCFTDPPPLSSKTASLLNCYTEECATKSIHIHSFFYEKSWILWLVLQAFNFCAINVLNFPDIEVSNRYACLTL